MPLCNQFLFIPIARTTSDLLYVSIILPFLDILNKWNHATCGFAPGVLTYYFKVHSLLPHISIFLFNAEYYSITWMYHILFLHSLVDRHLACFQILAIINNDAMNIYRIFRTTRHTPPLNLGGKWGCVLESECSLHLHW